MAASNAERGDGGVSPSSSPRFPSPPPAVEVQFGPKSPSVSGMPSEFSLDNVTDEGASRRIRPGTKAMDMAKGPPFVPLHQLESPFQLQEYLKSLYIKLTSDEISKTMKPVSKEMALELATPPIQQDSGESVDRNLWLYELCRFLCSKTGRLIGAFFADTPPCSTHTCPEMRASEWQYLCAVHEPPKSCCAIDYCCHTLDWASNILTSPKHFPSRLSLGGEGGNAYQSMRQLTNIFRRVYRIYAHAWFQHREVFWTIEAELGLYIFFKTVCDQYQLIPDDNYTIPPEAEGGAPEEREDIPAINNGTEKASNVSILRKDSEKVDNAEEDQPTSGLSTGATTRRHKHTPSTGVPVAVIAEGQEEEEEEETTILDIGAPGPAQESSPSLSPPKPRIERARSPGRIEIPQNIDAERVPEDPTPVALYESNPFGSPGPSEETRIAATESEVEIVTTPEKSEDVSIIVDKAKNELLTTTLPQVKDESEAESVPIDHSGDADKSITELSGEETKTTVDAVPTTTIQDDDAETMTKIDDKDIEPYKNENTPDDEHMPGKSDTIEAEEPEKTSTKAETTTTES